MALIYAVSDIHGELELFKQALAAADLDDPDNKLVLLGDYIDGGPQSGGTLRYIHALQREHGGERVVALKGNHEAELLEWLDAYGGKTAPIGWNDWLRCDMAGGFGTLRTLLTLSQWVWLRRHARAMSEEALNVKAARLVLDTNRELVEWLRAMPCYYETERQIFVHAGVDEEAGDWWKWGTDENVFVGKFPASMGPFYKDIVAGHVGAAYLAGDPACRVFWDGESHYYIDGTVAESRCLPLLKYDTRTGRYTQIAGGREGPVAGAGRL